MANQMVHKLNRLLIEAETEVERLTKENQMLKGVIDQACDIYRDSPEVDEAMAAGEMYSLLYNTKVKN